MDYNYQSAPFYASLVNTELVVDGTEKRNVVIQKRVIAETPPHATTTTFYTYDVTGLTITQIDELTRQKIQELNG